MDAAGDTFAFVQYHYGDAYGTTFGNERWGFYDCTGTPTSVFDGVTRRVGAQTYATYYADYQTRLNEPTDVTVQVSGTQVSGPVYDVGANVCIEPDGTGKTMRVYIVQVLDYWPASPTYHRNGFKQGFRTTGGDDITLAPGECQLVTTTFEFDDDSWGDQENMKLIAWVQEPLDNWPAEVYQSGATAWPFIADCNENTIPDECDIDCGPPGEYCDVPDCGQSEDCNDNVIPDECESQADCQPNGVQDICDIASGTSQDCNGNTIPDECDIADGTSVDCNLNEVPDDCDLEAGTSQDCNRNDVPDECDIDSGVSQDCNETGVPDECETDCNDNGFADECDIAVGTSGDCNDNGRPDECDLPRCFSLWDGFNDLDQDTPIDGLDYDGDGVTWSNPENTAEISGGGCENGTFLDMQVQSIVDTGLPAPEDGYLTSEYLQSDGGYLPLEDQVYVLDFEPKFLGATNARTDWQFSIHDGINDLMVAMVQFCSSVSLMTGYPGEIVVADPAGGYLDTGVAMVFGTCFHIEIALDNVADTVQVFIDGEDVLGGAITALEAGARRMDYIRLQPVANGATTTGNMTMRSDVFNLCATGGAAVPPEEWDCNGNGVLDSCDIEDGTSYDWNGNGVPDDCECTGLDCCSFLSDPPVCIGDVNGDSAIEPTDVGLVKFFYGDTGLESICRYDVNCDGSIDPTDVGLVKYYYGTCGGDPGVPPPCWAQ
ncbi:MAG: hypothetical protein JSV78_14645 [Phycisphaerales bacterium]|nr:MAG: hypothetical protein JSV78_14645 [Phycisphaerales bacterium]